MNKFKLAYSTDTVTNPKAVNAEISIEQFIDIIQTPAPSQRKLIDRIRTTVEMSVDIGMSKSMVSGSVSDLKKQLHFSIVSGYQEIGHNNKDIALNGLAQIDIDFKEAGGDIKALETKDLLKELPYVVAAFISPSGVGVKAIIRADVSKDNWNAAMNAINTKISEDINVSFGYFDSLGASQPSYMSYDKDVYYNAGALDNPIAYTIKNTVRSTNSPKVTPTMPEGDMSIPAVTDEAKFASVCGSLDKKYESFDTVWLQKSIPIFLGNAFDATALHEYLKTRYGVDFNTKRQKSFIDMYERYSHIWGSAYVQQYNGLQSDKEFTINQYLTEQTNHLNTIIQDKKLVNLIAPTGSGKTHYVINGYKGNKILVLPSQNQVKQIQSDYAADVYYEDGKTATKDSTLIATTYNSFARLASKIDLTKYTVFFDEAHNFAVSASRSFWYYNMKSATDIVDGCKNTVKFVLMTATPFNSFSIDTFKDFHTVNVTKKSHIEKSVNVLSYSNKNTAILNTVKYNKSNDILTVIVLQNTKEDGQLGRIKDLLSDYNVTCFNSKTKETQEFKELIVEGKVDKSTDVVITTTVIKEGLNITNHKANIAVLSLTTLHPIEYEQIAARFRKSTNISLTLMRGEATVDEYVSKQKALNTEALLEDKWAQTAYIKKAYSHVNPMERKATHAAFRDVLDSVCEVSKHGKFTIEPLLIANWLFSMEARYCSVSYEYLAGYLKQYGWKIGANEIEDEGADDELEYELAESAKDRKKRVLADKTKKAEFYMENIKHVEILEAYYDDAKDKQSKEILGQALSLSKKVNQSPDKVFGWLIDVQFKEANIKMMKNQLAWQAFTQTVEYEKSSWKAFIEQFQTGEMFSSQVLKAFILEFGSELGGMAGAMRNVSMNKILKFYRQFFNLNKTRDAEGNDVFKIEELDLPFTPRVDDDAKFIQLMATLKV